MTAQGGTSTEGLDPQPSGRAGRYLIGIDVGGTFTDLLAYDPVERVLRSAKVPSLPGAQWRGVLDALDELGIAPEAIRAFVHGTTIATNTLLERKGAPTALITTRGFRDVLEIGKGRRLVDGGLFRTDWQRPAPLIPRNFRFEVPERIASDGTVLEPISTAELKPVADALRDAGVASIAVSFINSYRNAENEEAAAAALQDLLADIPVSRSSALVPERGEFERTSTCVLNAYLTPVMTAYLSTLRAELDDRGVAAPVNIMGSNGGAMTLEVAAARVAGTFLSGPVGGVTGAVRVAEMAGWRNIITFDMGGTSTDVALVHDLAPRMAHDNQIDAYPLQMPQLDIHTIGAGGGSIVWIQPDGTLGVGPRSAGAVPGPACYGRGGDMPTISDANLLLGRLPTARSLSGGLTLDRSAAEKAFVVVATKLGTADLVALADGALAIAVAKMAGAVREVSVHRGFDPREFALVGFGGAGPMHLFLVAQELGVTRVMVPRFPGHLSALGQMLSDIRRDFVLAWGGRLSELAIGEVRDRVAAMRRDAGRLLEEDGSDPTPEEVRPEHHGATLGDERLHDPVQMLEVDVVAALGRHPVGRPTVAELERLIAADVDPPLGHRRRNVAGQLDCPRGVLRRRFEARRLAASTPEHAREPVGTLGEVAVLVVGQPSTHVAEPVHVGDQRDAGCRRAATIQPTHVIVGERTRRLPHDRLVPRHRRTCAPHRAGAR